MPTDVLSDANDRFARPFSAVEIDFAGSRKQTFPAITLQMRLVLPRNVAPFCTKPVIVTTDLILL